MTELGCTITPSSNIRMAIEEWGAKNFKSIHSRRNTLPWRCLVSCPMVEQSLEALSKNIDAAPVFEASPLFDPRSCYHRTLPMAVRRDSGSVTIRESSNGGVLISIPLDADREVDDPVDRVEQTVRVELREMYHRDVGFPRTAAVLEVESPPQT